MNYTAAETEPDSISAPPQMKISAPWEKTQGSINAILSFTPSLFLFLSLSLYLILSVSSPCLLSFSCLPFLYLSHRQLSLSLSLSLSLLAIFLL